MRFDAVCGCQAEEEEVEEAASANRIKNKKALLLKEILLMATRTSLLLDFLTLSRQLQLKLSIKDLSANTK